MLSGAGVQRSETPAESKHPYRKNNGWEHEFSGKELSGRRRQKL